MAGAAGNTRRSGRKADGTDALGRVCPGYGIGCDDFGMAHTNAKSREPHALLTVRECASRLRVSEETIRRRVDDGSLASVRLGSVRRVFASELDRLTEERSR